MEQFRVKPIDEADVELVVQAAGGSRAHADADRRKLRSADFRLGGALIELKSLNEDGLAKPERQQKLANLFRRYHPGQPVIVLDRSALPEDGRREYDHIVAGPIRVAVASARKQLKQSRREVPDAPTSVCFFVNNSYTAVDHEALLDMVAHRVRQDTDEIDGVVVAGCYFRSDGFDNAFDWPISYRAINELRPFDEFGALRAAWNRFSQQFMTKVVLGEFGPEVVKCPIVDAIFDVDNVRYLLPAPPMGSRSQLFPQGRPRKDSAAHKRQSIIAETLPGLTLEAWRECRRVVPDPQRLCSSYEDWQAQEHTRRVGATPLSPLVTVRVVPADWLEWCRKSQRLPMTESLCDYAREVFLAQSRTLCREAQEACAVSKNLGRHVHVRTEVLGQDAANDLSHISLVESTNDKQAARRWLVQHARLPSKHARILASAYAFAEDASAVVWEEDRRYAWE